MKKFSFLFLIIILFLNNLVLTQDVNELEKLVGSCTAVIDWFKKNGLYDSFVNAINQGGKQAGVKICQQVMTRTVCPRVIEILMNCLK